jgi:hypothetical protein
LEWQALECAACFRSSIAAEQIVGRERNQRACHRQLVRNAVVFRRVNSNVRLLSMALGIYSRSAILSLGLIVLTNGCSSKHPSDQSLLTNFQNHRTEFDQLLQTFLADKGLGRVAYDFTRPENPQTIGISPDRLQQYRKLFGRLGLSEGIEGYDEKDLVWFHASAQGLSVTGSGKGYAYLTKPPPLVVDSLDNYWSKDGKSFTAFRHIEGNWYLYLEYED